MSSMSKTKAIGWVVAATLVAGTTLSGCSDIYYDRRETISLGADDAVSSNRVTHMVDPWPAYSANRNLAFNGERIQAAAQRYRENKVTVPVSATTSSGTYQQQQQAAAAAVTAAQAASAAAPVK
jgi:hypothetical protein